MHQLHKCKAAMTFQPALRDRAGRILKEKQSNIALSCCGSKEQGKLPWSSKGWCTLGQFYLKLNAEKTLSMLDRMETFVQTKKIELLSSMGSYDKKIVVNLVISATPTSNWTGGCLAHSKRILSKVLTTWPPDICCLLISHTTLIGKELMREKGHAEMENSRMGKLQGTERRMQLQDYSIRQVAG
ncbi:hypothetical protein SDJN03_18521, partial [Cucurbita argyrosperma subsp. sororia]